MWGREGGLGEPYAKAVKSVRERDQRAKRRWERLPLPQPEATGLGAAHSTRCADEPGWRADVKDVKEKRDA